MNGQQVLMQQCKDRLAGKSLAVELSDLLGVTTDAAYRRIRGETALTFDEIEKICVTFHVSFDSIANYSGKLVPFQFQAMFDTNFSILNYLKNFEQELKTLGLNENTKIVMTLMDMPYFRQFGLRNLSRFKLFFWMRSVLNHPDVRHKKFDLNDINEDFEKVTRNIFVNYHRVDSEEIWAPETLDSTIKQITYYVDSGLFADDTIPALLCDDLEEMLDLLESEAERGQKSLFVDGETITSSFKMYQSDIYLSNNSVQGYLGDKVYTYVSFNSFNSLMSFSPNFSKECTLWIEQIRSKSILLSEVSEKLRYQFFASLRNKVIGLRQKVNG